MNDLFTLYGIEDQPRQPVGAGMATPARPPIPRAPGAGGRSWGSVAGDAVSNFLPSLGHFAEGVVHPFTHPVQTGRALLALGDAIGSKVSRPGDLVREQDAAPSPEQLQARAAREAPLDEVARFFSDRYGSIEGLKNTIATDPVGFSADLSVPLTLGRAAPLRGAEIVGRVGAALDPLMQIAKVAELSGKGVGAAASAILGGTTGAGGSSVRTAAKAGFEGGEQAASFLENMRGNVPMTDAVDMARRALDQVRAERGADYRAGMANIGKDKTILDFADIDAALGKANEVGTYKGQVIEPKAAGVVAEMNETIQKWKALDPAEFHTAEGIDALKRSLGNIRDSYKPHTPERVAADRIYSAVRGEITRQAPEYAKIMEAYSKASEHISEAGGAFALGNQAKAETSLRKLQSTARNNANTNWGERVRLLETLAEHEPNLPYAIAGQSLNAIAPRGLVARGLAGAGGTTAGATLATGGIVNPLAALAIPAFMPRVVGEGAYYSGKAAGGIDRLAATLGINLPNASAAGQVGYQSGRSEIENDKRALALALRQAAERRAATGR